MIEVQDVEKSYGSLQAVKDVSFAIGSGEVVGLLGPNGAWKSTLIKILTTFHYPTGGSAKVDGVDVMEDPLQVRRMIGYLPEMAPLYEDMLVSEYLDFMRRTRGLSGAKGREAVDRAVADTGMEGYWNSPIGILSKGYRQRLGLAQAILHDPPILILDEPTTGLDPNQILEIRGLIRKLGERKTVILSTHILQEVEAVCGPVMIMNQGRIAAQGTADEIRESLSGDVVYFMRISGLDSPADLRGLEDCSGVLRVNEPEKTGGGVLEFSLAARQGDEPAASVFDWTVAQGGRILSMIPEKLSLEEIFVRLTSEEAAFDNTAGGNGGSAESKGGEHAQ